MTILDSSVERIAVALALSDDSPCPYGMNDCEAFDTLTGRPVAKADVSCRCRRLARVALEAFPIPAGTRPSAAGPLTGEPGAEPEAERS